MPICIEFSGVNAVQFRKISDYLEACVGKGTRNHYRQGEDYGQEKIPYLEIEKGEINGNPIQAKVIRIIPTDATFVGEDAELKRIDAMKGLVELMREENEGKNLKTS